MSKPPSPLIGYNHNFRHRGRVLHVQTEDSGVKYPHVITHLFADGGRIIKSVKTSYADLVDQPKMAEKVRELMRKQHKAMIVALRDGRYDELIEGKQASDAPPSSPPKEHGAEEPSPEPAPQSDDDVGRRPSIGALALAKLVATTGLAPVVEPESPTTERDPSDAHPAVLPPTGPTLPPPPSNISPDERAARPAIRPRVEGARGRDRSEERRYAQARPPAIFVPSPASKGDFGQRLISDRSLDEVILSYLQGDEPDEPLKR